MSIMNKTLFIAPFKDMSGYAQAARNYARLFQKKTNIVLRAVRYDSGSQTKTEPWLVNLMMNPMSDEISTVIQMLTPNEMRPIEGKNNIAICCWETDRIPKHWVEQLNKFNTVIVPCHANKTAFIESGVTVPIKVIPFAFFKEDYDLTNVTKLEIPGTNPETIIYYNIAQWSQKKGTDSLVRGYFRAFQNNENVILLLKGYIGMFNQQGDAQKLIAEVDNIRKSMRLPTYPKIYITDALLDETGIKRLHHTAHCYVNASKGEGWCIPAYEALAYGKELISVNHTGMEMYITDNARVIKSHADYVYGMGHPDPALYTSLEKWYEPDMIDLVSAFQKHYNSIEKINTPEKYTNMIGMSVTEIKKELEEIING